MGKRYRIAVIPGDGIGKEVVPEGLRALETAGRRFGIAFDWDELPWSCDYYASHGRLMPGVPSPLANRKPGDIDFVVVRENTEGEYSSIGGRMFEGTEREIVFQESVFSRKGVDRIMNFAFDLAGTRPAKHL